jgi:hypothetical protein
MKQIDDAKDKEVQDYINKVKSKEIQDYIDNKVNENDEPSNFAKILAIISVLSILGICGYVYWDDIKGWCIGIYTTMNIDQWYQSWRDYLTGNNNDNNNNNNDGNAPGNSDNRSKKTTRFNPNVDENGDVLPINLEDLRKMAKKDLSSSSSSMETVTPETFTNVDLNVPSSSSIMQEANIPSNSEPNIAIEESNSTPNIPIHSTENSSSQNVELNNVESSNLNSNNPYSTPLPENNDLSISEDGINKQSWNVLDVSEDDNYYLELIPEYEMNHPSYDQKFNYSIEKTKDEILEIFFKENIPALPINLQEFNKILKDMFVIFEQRKESDDVYKVYQQLKLIHTYIRLNISTQEFNVGDVIKYDKILQHYNPRVRTLLPIVDNNHLKYIDDEFLKN